MKVERLITWKSTSGKKKSIILVTDETKESEDIDHKKIEFCEFDSENETWGSGEKIDFIEEVQDVGIPDSGLA